MQIKECLHSQVIEASLRQLFPDSLFFEEEFDSKLPIFRWFWKDGYLSLHLVCRHRFNVGKFFYEMIHRWLLPGRRLDVEFFFFFRF